MDPEQRLAEIGLTLPDPIAPSANYVPFVQSGGLVFIAGQVATDHNGGIRGVVGVDLGVERATSAARICALNVIAQMKAACGGNLRRVAQIVRVTGFVQAGSDFYDIPIVINGASDLFVQAFGDQGRHSRTAVGVYRLPKNFAVEVDAVFEIA